MRPTVTYIWGSMATGKTTLAKAFADARGPENCAIVDRREGETVRMLCERHPVPYLYILDWQPPAPEEMILIGSVIKLGRAQAAA